MARPLFDVVADFTAGPPNIPGASAVSLNSVAGTRTQDWSIRRGRTYELGNAEAGVMTLNMFDRAENLNPVNGSSPWNISGNTLLPYRCIQRAAIWNATTLDTTGNILNSANTPPGSTTAYDPSFETTVGWTQSFGTAATRTQSTTQAFNGTHSCAISLTGSTDRAGALLWTVPGQTYTLSAYVFVPATYTVTLTFGQYSPSLTTYGSVTSSTTGAWQRLTITAVATNAVSYFQVRSGTAPSFPFTVYLDACQLELASSASAFATTGPKRYPRYTGYIERYPQTWVDAGFRGMKPLEAVDALSVLSRTVINQSYQATILADNPIAYIPYNDTALPQKVILPQGGQPFLGYQNLGTQGSVNFAGDTFLDGSSALSVTQQNTNPVTTGNAAYVTYSYTINGALTMLPSGCSLEFWVKPVSGLAYFGAASVPPGENILTESAGPAYYLGWYSSAGKLDPHYADPGGGGVTVGVGWPNGQPSFPDGNWHHLVVMLASNNIYISIDGNPPGFAGLGFTPSTAVRINSFFVMAQTYYGDPTSQVSVANVAMYPAKLTNAQVAAHYNRGAGYINEISGARVARLLGQYWSSTNYSAAPGYIAMAPDFNYDPVGNPVSARTMLDVLQEISTTENGFIYANVSGAVVWEDRTTRVAQQTSIATIGQAVGQVHYENLEYDYDPTYVYSQVNLSRPANSTFAPQVNSTSQAAYGQRILSATLQVNTDFDLNQAAIFYLNRYDNPGGAPGTTTGPRIRKLILNPAKDPTMWGFVLGLELSQRVTCRFTTSTGLPMVFDYYVENIVESGSPAEGTYEVALQLSPVFVSNSWVLGDATYGVLGTTTIPVY